MDIAENTILGERYRITRLLGQGGMGAVYLACDRRFRESPVAVKRTLVARDREDLRKAFQREAMLLYHLRHPALPRVIDYFGQGDSEFLVMEFVPGEDFGAMLSSRRGAYPIEQVAVWADKLLDVLSYLHTRKPPVIHRDIKPQNMKLTPDGEIVLLDFGLAKGSVAVGLQTVTTTASVLAGTRYYAPPEQLSGQGTDERSDLYSLAATLYSFLTAMLPADAAVRASCHINGQADPLRSVREVNPSVPAAVSAVIDRAMRLRKDERPSSAAAMREALRSALTTTVPAAAESLAATGSVESGNMADLGPERGDESRAAKPSPASSSGMQMVEKTVAALGGDAFVDQTSTVLKGTGTAFTDSEHAVPIQSISWYWAYPVKFRLETDFGNGVVKLVVANGDSAWSKTADGVSDISEVVKVDNRHGIEILRRLGSGSYTARALDDGELDGKPVKTFAVSDAEGHETTFYVDPTTSLPVKLAYRKYEALLSDYRRVSGVQVACAIQWYGDGAKILEATYTDAQVNVYVDPELFERP